MCISPICNISNFSLEVGLFINVKLYFIAQCLVWQFSTNKAAKILRGKMAGLAVDKLWFKSILMKGAYQNIFHFNKNSKLQNSFLLYLTSDKVY